MNEQLPYNNGSGTPDEIRLLRFLRGEMSQQEAAELQQEMNTSDFEKDALEGLQQLPNEILPGYVKEINGQVAGFLSKKQHRRKRRGMPSLQWILITVFVVLALLVLGYVVIHFYG